MGDLSRRPKLALCFSRGEDHCTIDVLRERSGSPVRLFFYIINRGERTSTNAYIELYVPLMLLNNVNPSDARFTIDEMECIFFTFPPLERVWPSDVPQAVEGEVRLNFQPGNHYLYWRNVDDFGRHPITGGFGKLLVKMGYREQPGRA